MRLRITFAKTSAMRYTSHLDLQRTWERTIRRADLPLTYSQGFNPRPKINLAAALPLGFTSSCELLEIWLSHDQPEKQVEARLRSAAPPGIEIITVEAVDLKSPKLPNLIHTAIYEVTFAESILDLAARIDKILSEASLIRERRGKEYDLRPLIDSIEVINPTPEGQQRIRLRLASRPGATGRPDEVLAALDILTYNAQFHRTHLFLIS
jgi:radical SAM-linked protein